MGTVQKKEMIEESKKFQALPSEMAENDIGALIEYLGLRDSSGYFKKLGSTEEVYTE